ncbi:MAG: oligogalacturonide lyase, partial [Candidatus Latescibacteria bacterium]|nr:oligogalacturonide lyase [Candidatus Latescibacterota bacterium]
MSIGKVWSSEITEFEDVDSGAKVKQLTQHRAHSHHFYFTNSGWYANDTKLLVASDRNNATNLYGIDLQTGDLQQLTDLEPIPLPREVEFLRACVNPTKDEAYFWYGLDLVALDLTNLESRVLYTMEEGWDVSMNNCAADGAHVYASISEDMSHRFRVDYLRGYVGFAETWEAMPLSKIIKVATDGSGGGPVFEEKYWIGHVNTSPTKSNILTYCHEGPWHKVDNRIWGFDVDTGKAWKIRAPQ